MKKSVIAIIIGATLALTGCGGKIDGRSPEAFESSIKSISDKMTPEEQRAFGRDLAMATSLRQMNMAHAIDKNLKDELMKKVYAEADGKTPKEIHQMAEKVRAQIKDDEINTIKQKIAEEENSLSIKSSEIEELKKIIISDIHITAKASPNPYNKEVPTYATTLEFSVTNKTKYSITSIGVMPEANDVNAPKPWSFHYNFPQKLNPGQTTKVILDKTILNSGWENYNPPKNVSINLTKQLNVDIDENGKTRNIFSDTNLDEIRTSIKNLQDNLASKVSQKSSQ